jgi:hypothetical protein
MISHFPKPKDASYFLIAGNPQKSDILALKRVSFSRLTTKNLSVALPANFKKEKLEIHLLCDSYIGLDQYHHVDLLNINEYIESKSPQPVAIKNPAKCEKEPSSSTVAAYTGFRNLQKEVLEDVHNEIEDRQAITRLLESTSLGEEDIDAKEFRQDDYDEEDAEEDYEAMIEKELDNWF